MSNVRKYWVIQAKGDGRFLTEDLRYTENLAFAGRLYDVEEAIETARYNLGEDYRLHSSYELVVESD